MARLPAFVADLAAHDRRGRPTVEVIARTIRERGLISTTKRGRGAADMTTEDAAALLIALCVSESPASAPEITSRFLALQAITADTYIASSIGKVPEIISLIAGEAQLQGVITRLLEHIDKFIDLRLASASFRASARQPGHPPDAGLYAFQSEFIFEPLLQKAEFYLRWRDESSAGVEQHYTQQFRKLPPSLADIEYDDRTVRVSLGWRTLMRVGALLRRDRSRAD